MNDRSAAGSDSTLIGATLPHDSAHLHVAG